MKNNKNQNNKDLFQNQITQFDIHNGIWLVRLSEWRKYDKKMSFIRASVSRCQNFLDGTITAGNSDDDKNSLLTSLMEQEPCLKEYLQKVGNSNSELAFKLAQADIAYYESLMSSDHIPSIKNIFSTSIMKVTIMPLLLVFLTAILGTFIASSLQEESFKRQKVFEVKLESLKEGRQRSAKLLSNLRYLKPILASWEIYGGGITPRSYLGEYGKEIEQIKALGVRLGDEKNTISMKTTEIRHSIGKYLECLEKLNRIRTQKEPKCSKKFELRQIEELVSLFSDSITRVAEAD